MSGDADTTSKLWSKPWSRRSQKAGVIVWSSFLAACLATMVFFAIFDPLLLGDDDQPPAWLPSHMTGYALGFFFFWAMTTLTALLTAYLLDTLPPNRSDKDAAASGRKP